MIPKPAPLSLSDFHTLNRQAWEARFRDPAAIEAIADRMVELSADGSVEKAWGHLHRAVAFRFKRDISAVNLCIASAETAFRIHRNDSGIAMCREQRARIQANAGNEAAARAIAEENSPALRSILGDWERFALADLDVIISTRFSSPEATIRLLSKAVVAARATGDRAAMAQTQSMLAGKHAELNNYQTAFSLGLEAHQLASEFKPGTAWYICALNLLLIYNGMERAAEAMHLTRELEEFDEQFYLPIREQSNLLYARAYLLAGDPDSAQAALNNSRKLVAAQTQVHSWTSTQANLYLQKKEPNKARLLCAAWIESTTRVERALTPSAALRIYRAAAMASEELGDFRSALGFEREAARYNEIELGRAALAHRVALEVEYDFDRERASRDVAERKRLESDAERLRLDELNQKLDAALQTRTRFLAVASHDLRQPAHALALYAATLEHETSRPALVELSKRMRATVGSLSNMFDGLLELARLDADAVKPQHEVFDLTDLLARLCSEYSGRLSRVDALLKLRRTRADCFICSDAVLVERVLRNLIGNAVKYAGEGNILVALRKRDTALSIEVRDAGPGMSDDEQRHIFDEFFRARSAQERRDGLGLGLSIVERFARLLDMQVRVRSAVGRGSTFALDVPLAALATAPERKPEISARPLTGRALTVAVVDDDPDSRGAMSLLLSKWGHLCVAGASAEAVLAQCQQTGVTPDAVVTDFQLRDGNAIAGIDALRSKWGSDLPVLVVSGSSDAQASVEARFTDVSCLPKPVRPLRLKSWLSAQTSLAAPGGTRDAGLHQAMLNT